MKPPFRTKRRRGHRGDASSGPVGALANTAGRISSGPNFEVDTAPDLACRDPRAWDTAPICSLPREET
jgi:hypothetical protein